MKIKVYIFILFLAINAKGIPQCLTVNLIQNPGLEDYSCCPNKGAKISCANYWTQPIVNHSTSEYFNTCGLDSILFPNWIRYFQHAYFGNGYAGICVINYNLNFPQYPQYREYLQGELAQPLIASQCYYSRFWVKLMNFLPFNGPFSAIDAIGIYFTDTLPQQIYAIDPMAMYYPAQINNTPGRIISDTTDWTMISDTFVAQGGEKYFTVGTFKYSNEMNQIIYGMPNMSAAYYFFDNFSLCPCEDTIPKTVLPETPTISIPNVFTPNGDGYNDSFYAEGKKIQSLYLAVYNRWGKLIFETNNPNFAWDGTQGGEPCAPGVYYYVAEVVFANGEKENKKGTITLVR